MGAGRGKLVGEWVGKSMCTCVHVHAYTSVCVRVSVYVCLHFCLNVCLSVCGFVSVSFCIPACLSGRVYFYVYICFPFASMCCVSLKIFSFAVCFEVYLTCLHPQSMH